MDKNLLKKMIKNCIMIITGSFIYGFGINIFIKANGLALGGFSGIGLLINYNFGLPIGLFTLIANIPLLIISFKVWGRKYIIGTLVGVIASSIALDALSVLSLSVDDPLLPAIYGGLCTGVGTGIVMRGGGTLGGTDILAQLCNKYKGTSLGTFYLIFDACVLAAVALMYGLTVTLYSLVTVFMSSTVINKVVDGLDSGKQAFIMSKKPDEIADFITNDLKRGFTFMHGQGGYQRKEMEVIVCVVSRWQIFRLRQGVHHIDPNAFIIINDAHEVYGEGFKHSS